MEITMRASEIVVESADNIDQLTQEFVDGYSQDPMGMFTVAKESYLSAVSTLRSINRYAADLSDAHKTMSRETFQDTVIKHFAPYLKKHGWPKFASAAWGEAEHEMRQHIKNTTVDQS
jgi:hypothetical protein